GRMSFLLTSLEAVEGNPVLIGAELGIYSPAGTEARLKQITAIHTRSYLHAAHHGLCEFQPETSEECVRGEISIWPSCTHGPTRPTRTRGWMGQRKFPEPASVAEVEPTST